MHPTSAHVAADNIDYNLYPALIQVFLVILIGYIAGYTQILTKSQAVGLNKFVGKFALPALLFRSLATLDFSVVNWLFLLSIFISKSVVFFAVILISFLTIRPFNYGQAAIYAIFVSQSNDFALGFPIVKSIYSISHPDYLHYIYLLAPISLCILNPIAFLMLETNEKIHQNKAEKKLTETSNQKSSDETSENEEKGIASNTDDDDDDEDEDNDPDKTILITKIEASISKNPKINESSFVNDSAAQTSDSVNDETRITSLLKSSNDKIGKNMIKSIIYSTLTNPIVFMTFIGIVANFLLKQNLPILLRPLIDDLADSFSAIALFYLGFTMFGKIKNLKLMSILVILMLIFTKSILFPLITRETVLHLESFRNLGANATSDQLANLKNETESLSTFGFLYGTFPTAPSLFFYIGNYKFINSELISAALVIGTLVSAPLMMISGKMISLEFDNNTQISNFVDIECKSAFGFSILTVIGCLWVIYIFVISGLLFKQSHRYTFYLIIAQMINAIVHIFWSYLSDDITPTFSYLYVILELFTSFLTRCMLISIMLNMFFIYVKQQKVIFHDNENPIYLKNRFIFNNFANSEFMKHFVGICIPIFLTSICLISGRSIPTKQSIMITLGKPQIIISIILLAFTIISVAYLIIVFFQLKNNRKMNKRKIKYDNQLNESQTSQINEPNEAFLNDEQEILLNENETKYNRQRKNNDRATTSRDLDDIEIADPVRATNKKLKQLKHEHQMMQQVALAVTLTFTALISLFFQFWALFDEWKSAIFYELQLLDVTLLYGQVKIEKIENLLKLISLSFPKGFFVFIIFGFNNEFIFSPFIFKIKEWLNIIVEFQLPKMEQISKETIELCQLFEKKYKQKCINCISCDRRFHTKYYKDVFTGKEFINWLMKKRLIKNRKQGIELGRKLIMGRIIHHVSHKRNFHDDFNFYSFN